jgi:excisionase family DNA binding protein
MIVPHGTYGVFFGSNRPACPSEASLSRKETTQMIAVPEETVSRIADFLERIAEYVERLGPKEEIKEEPNQRPLTPEEASKILRIHVQTVTAWCREGKIRAFKNGGNEANGKGGKWLIPREEIDAYLHRQQVIHGKTKGGAK